MTNAFESRPGDSLSELSLAGRLGEFLNVYDVARLLDCAEVTVEEWLRSGALPGLKIGRGWVVPRNALVECVNTLAIESAKALKAKGAGVRHIAVQLDNQKSDGPLNAKEPGPRKPGRKRNPATNIISFAGSPS